MEELEVFLFDAPISPEIVEPDCDPGGDAPLIEKMVFDEPLFSFPPKDVVVKDKPSDPLELELEDFVPEYENFIFDTAEESSGNPTSHFDFSLPAYEAFSFDIDLLEETSSGNTTSHSYISLPEYDAFHFDMNDLYHEEFSSELSHIISPPEYDHFYFDPEDDSSVGGGVIDHKNLLLENFIPTLPPVEDTIAFDDEEFFYDSHKNLASLHHIWCDFSFPFLLRE